MRRRGALGLLALLALGLVGGYAAATAAGDDTADGGPARPVAAHAPSLPADPRGTLLPDPDHPALRPGLPLERTTLGADGFEISFPVPVGWKEKPKASNESKWKPRGAPDNTFILRVRQVFSERQTLAEAADDEAERLLELQDHAIMVDQRPGLLEYTAVSDERTARRGYIRWLDLTGSGFAEVEIAVTGRESDAEGARDLVDRIAEGVRPLR